MEYQYKYLHVIFYNDINFYVSLINGINKNPLLMPAQHFFVTDKERVYDKIKKYNNTLLIKSTHLLKHMRNAKWIIFHAMPLKKWQFCCLPNSLCEHVVWRTWGHDIRPCVKTGRKIYDYLKKVEFKLFVYKIKKIYALGVANLVDVVNFEEVYNFRIKTFLIEYTDSSESAQIVKSISPLRSNNGINILIGHNCSPVDNHLEVLNSLEKFKNDNIHIIIPLSYSDPKNGYKEQVIKKAYDIFGKDKVTILKDFMPYDQYVKMISQIDVAIMDMYYSNGLGNLDIILYYKKKLYIRKNGNMDKAFRREGIVPNYTCDISNSTFEELHEYKFDVNYLKFCESIYNEKFFENCWRKVMDECGD